MLSLPGGARRLANVHKLLRLAAEHERDNGRDVRGLVDLATAELEADARETDAPVELGDVKAVRLMTIHAAKGLEFGVVVRRRPRPPPPAATPTTCSSSGDEVGLRLVGLDGSSEKALDYEALHERVRERAARRGGARPLRRADARPRAAHPQRRRRRSTRGRRRNHGAAPLSWLGPALLGGDLGRLPTRRRARCAT